MDFSKIDKRLGVGAVLVAVIVVSTFIKVNAPAQQKQDMEYIDSIRLPDPSLKGAVSVEEALAGRRSRRSYEDEPLTKQELSQILWAAQGITDRRGLRTSPSAGATYPLELYAVVGEVEDLAPGAYRFLPEKNQLELMVEGDLRSGLYDACLSQGMISDAPATLVFSAVYERTTDRYGERGVMYVHMEAGHAGQNIYLQAESLGLGTCAVGAISPKEISKLLDLRQDEEPIYVFPVGRL